MYVPIVWHTSYLWYEVDMIDWLSLTVDAAVDMIVWLSLTVDAVEDMSFWLSLIVDAAVDMIDWLVVFIVDAAVPVVSPEADADRDDHTILLGCQ